MEKQLVIFELGEVQFGIEIAAVEGIVKMQEITKVPFAPPFMEGITNLRGSVLPIIDLNKRFGLEPEAETRETRIITVILDAMKIGMIVSAVSEVLTIDDSTIEPTPAMCRGIRSEFIVGVAKIGARLVILLDLTKMLSAEEQKLALEMAASQK
jgi:purine-binding chemotaxis protein CheW